MIKAKDIKDRESLERWLTSWPASRGLRDEEARRVVTQMARRAALRVFPLIWPRLLTNDAGEPNSKALSVFRNLALTGGASTCPIEDSGRFFNALEAAAVAHAERDTAKAAFASDSAIAAAAAVDAIVTAVNYAEETYVENRSDTATTANVRASDEMWEVTKDDAKHIESGASSFEGVPLFRYLSTEIEAGEEAFLKFAQANAPIWDFWVRFWDMAKSGHVPPWEMLLEVAKIEEADWEAGPARVAELIVGIELANSDDEKAAKKPSDFSLRDVFTATLYDFTFDKQARLMRAIPIASDWKHLKEPNRVSQFLEDATDLREDLETLCKALTAEGGGMQGAGGVRTYLSRVLTELDNAENVGTLRVGKLMEYGRILESASQKDHVLREFGVLDEPLKICVSKMRDLVRDHFSYTLSRMEVLRNIRLDEGDDPAVVLREFKEIVAAVRSGDSGAVHALAPEDVAVLEDVLDSVDGQILALSNAADEGNRSSIKREIDFQMAKVGATAGLYREKAGQIAGTSDEVAGKVISAHKKYEGLSAFARAVKELFGY